MTDTERYAAATVQAWVLGWTRPKLRDSAAVDRWIRLVLAAHAQLRLARSLARAVGTTSGTEQPHPRPSANLREDGTPARAPKPSRLGPGRPPGSKNKRPVTRYDVGRILATGQLRPDWGILMGIVLLKTLEGWRHSVLTMEGGMLCGRLNVPINIDWQDARAAAAQRVTELARDFHDTDVAVSWDPPQEPWS